MRLLFTIIITVGFFCISKAQDGFIQTYEYPGLGTTFYDILLVEDTLIVFGGISSLPDYQWGLYFLKMDTLGNILDYKTHYDASGDYYSFGQDYQTIKTTDGGYAVVGQFLFRKTPFLMKLSVNGDLVFVKEYPDNSSMADPHWNIVEIEDGGFISTGARQKSNDFKFDAFVMRTDKNGEKIWEYNYGSNGVWDRFKGINKINENEFLITGSTSVLTSEVPTIYDMWGILRAIKIDTLGNVLWTWESDILYPGDTLLAFSQLFPSSDGNWVNEGSYATVLNADEIAFQGAIVKRDTNFNIIWSTLFGEPTSWRNNFTDLTPTPDGGWVASGQYVEPAYSYDGLRSVILAKVNADGDSLWSRIDTVFSLQGSTHYPAGVVSLPSGSIMACGYADRYQPAPGKSIAWLIKVDKHGCIEPGCNPLLDGLNLSPMLEEFKVFPNPTTDNIHISGEGFFDVLLYDLQGRLLNNKPDNYNSTMLNLKHLDRGIYFIKIRRGNLILTKKILKQ